MEGSAAAILVLAGQDLASSVVRLASADRALFPGRAEWVGLVLVLYIARRVQADIVLRLGKIQVVNTYNDGHVEYEWDWLRRNDRDLAALAWELNAERRRLGFGELVAVHQRGHPENNRKRPHEYDYHERYNAKVDALTHELTPDMPLYVPFERMGRAQTQVWYEPLEQEHVGRGTCHEVASGVYKHIARSAQRRASIAQTHSHEGVLGDVLQRRRRPPPRLKIPQFHV